MSTLLAAIGDEKDLQLVHGSIGQCGRTVEQLQFGSLGLWVQHFFKMKHPEWFTRLIQNKRSISLNIVICMTKDGRTVENVLFPEIPFSSRK